GYEGTADAVRQNLRYVQEDGGKDVLILSSDQLYRMDYAELLKTHRDTSADITLAVQPVARAQASRLGIVRVGDGERIVEVVEKPKGADQLDGLRTPPEWLHRHGL